MKTRNAVRTILVLLVTGLLASLSYGGRVSAQNSPTATPESPFAIADDLAEGWKFYFQGNYDQALTMFQHVIDANPKWLEGYLGRGVAYLGQKSYENGLADLDRAIEFDDNEGALYFYRSYMFIGMGKYPEAIASINQGLKLSPNLDFIYLYKGIMEQQLGLYNDALDNFNQAIALNPTSPDPFLQMAQIYKLQGKPTDAVAYNLIAEGLQAAQSGYVDIAVENLSKITDSALYNRYPAAQAYARYNRALMDVRLSEPDDAMTDYTEAIHLKSDFPQAYLERAALYGDQGDTVKEIADINQAIEIAPGFPLSYLRRATAEQKAGDSASALSDYMNWITLGQTRDFAGGPYKPGHPFKVMMGFGGVYKIPMRITAGQSVDITADTVDIDVPDNVADPLIVILDPNGVPLIASDDDGGGVNAAIHDYVLPTTGIYKVILTHGGNGAVGLIQANITVSNPSS